MATPQQEAEARALLAKGDTLGQAASAQTGMQYNPTYTTYTPSPTISSANLQGGPAPTIPPYQPPTIPSTADILAAYNTPTDTENKLQENENTLLGNVESIINKQGTQSARQGELENQAGIPGMQQNLNQYTAQINAVNASAFQATQNAEGRLAPTFSIYGEQAQIERQKSAQTFGLAAAASATQNNIALAETNVQRALDAEFGHLESQLQYQQMLLGINQDKMTKEQQKKAGIMQVQLQERERLLTEQKAERNNILNLMTTLASNGAPAELVNKLQRQTNFETAIALAAPYMQSPEAKLKLEAMRLDMKLSQAQLEKIRKETAQIGQPSATELKEVAAKIEAAKGAIPVVTAKIALIDSIIASPGLNSAVGPTWMQRIAVKDIGGAKDFFIGAVSNLVSKETIDTLLNLKAQGGTLGALSDQERVLLQTAATKIGLWAIDTDNDGKAEGYDIDQKNFIKELEEIKRLAENARDRAAGVYINADEQQVLTNFFQSDSSNFNPANYY